MPRNCISWKVVCVADCHLVSEAGGSAVTQARVCVCVGGGENELVSSASFALAENRYRTLILTTRQDSLDH